MTMSAPARPSFRLSNRGMSANRSSAGIRFAGPTKRTCAPRRRNRRASEPATRECLTSPQMAMTRPSSAPNSERIVAASSSACVGCSSLPAPPLTTGHSSTRSRVWCSPSSFARTIITWAPMAASVWAVSTRVSPLCTEEAETGTLMTSAPSFLPARSNDRLVRVESSKKRLICVLPARRLGAGAARRRYPA